MTHEIKFTIETSWDEGRHEATGRMYVGRWEVNSISFNDPKSTQEHLEAGCVSHLEDRLADRIKDLLYYGVAHS